MYKVDSLDNGLKIVTESMAHMESVAVGIWIRAGGRYENKATGGISHLLEHLLFKGTATRDMRAIKEAIEGRGGSFNGFTSEEHTCYLVKVLAKDTELGVDILSDMVLRPKLDPVEIEKEKNVIVEEINMYKDIPSHHVHEILAEMMWPGQPLGMPLAGTEQSVRSITRQSLSEYRDQYYSPGNMLVIGAGNVKENALTGLSAKYLSVAKPKKAQDFDKAVIKKNGPGISIRSKDTEQTHIALGIHAFDRFNPDKYVLSLLNVIMGANMSSRLFHIVRDEMALCYEISSSIRRYEDCGAMVISAGVDDKKMAKAIEVILGELSRIKTEPVAGEEIARAKEYYKGQLLFAMEDTMSRMLWIGEKVISGEKGFSVSGILKIIDSITADDISRVARDIFNADSMNLAVIGPVKDGSIDKEIFSIR